MIHGDKIAIFNRIYTGKDGKNDIYIIEFPEQLIFYKDNIFNMVYSNKYDISLDANLKKEDFYKQVQDAINIKYENGALNDVRAYTKSEWNEIVSTWDLPEVRK